MKYKSQPTLQITSAAIGVVVVVILEYLLRGEIDYLVVAAVALGVGFGMGFFQEKK